MLKKKFLYSLLCCFIVSSFSQEKRAIVTIDTLSVVEKKFDIEKIELYKNKEDFKYTILQETPSIFEQLTAWFTRGIRKIMSWFFDDIETPAGILLGVLRVLPYAVIVLLIYLIITFFLKINSRALLSKNINQELVHLSNEEKLLQSKDLPSLLSSAMEKENYRLAIRYQYILLLQQLSMNDVIVWQQQKTNKDYIKEVYHKNIHVEFEEITRFYDYVWYGNFQIDKDHYVKGMESILAIQEKIKE